MRLINTFKKPKIRPYSFGLILLFIGLFLIALLKTQSRFDESQFQMPRAVSSIQTLGSKELMGRGIGTSGQKMTELYLENYFKNSHLSYETVETEALLPKWSSESYLKIPNLNTYSIFKDFRPSADLYGKALNYSGSLLYLGQDLFAVPKNSLKDRVVVIQTNRLTLKQLDYLKSAGVLGVLYEITGYFGTAADPEDSLVLKDFSLKNKVDSTLFTAQISTSLRRSLAEIALKNPFEAYQPPTTSEMAVQYEEHIIGLIHNVTLKTDLNYEKIKLKQYLVTVKGKDRQKSTSFITHYDGNGLTKSHDIYPSILDGGASTALLLEIATVTANQARKPAHDVNFIFLEGLSNSLSPSQVLSEKLANNYSYNEVFILEALGSESNMLSFNYDNYNDLSRMTAANINSHQDRFFAPLSSGDSAFSNWQYYGPFNLNQNAVLSLSGLIENKGILPGGSLDRLESLNTDQLAGAANLILGHLDLELFKEKRFEYIKPIHMIFIALLGIVIFMLRRMHPVPKLILDTLIPFGISLILINVILCIPKDANLKIVGEVSVTNFSLYETIRTSYLGLLGFFSLFSISSQSILSEISLYLSRSFILIIWGLVIAVTLGLFKGLMDSYLHRKGNAAATWTSIMLYSIPDVLVAFLGLVAVVFLAKWPLTASWLDPEFTRKYLMPLISLCIVPSIYIARLVFVALESELQKDYVAFLRYKGLSTAQIYWRHFSKVGLIKILDMAKPIIMLIFSNLMIVEYLFNYPGIMYDLLSKRGEPLMVISMALSVGLSFTALFALSQLLARAISPRRSRQ